MAKRTGRGHFEEENAIALRLPKRACRRNINYQEVDERYDVGFVIDTFSASDYFERTMGSPPSYRLKIGDQEEAYNVSEMRRMFNEDLIEYLDFRKGRIVSMMDVWRLWLMEDSEGRTEEMDIDYIILPPDNVERYSPFHDAPGIYHGGEMDPVTKNIKWFPIKLHSLSFVNLVTVIDYVCAEESSSDDDGNKGLAFNIQENHEEFAAYTVILRDHWTCMHYLDNYCKQNRGKRLRVSGPGCRAPSSNICSQDASARQFVGGMPGLCIYGAFLNAIWLFCEWDYALRVLRTENLPIVWDLKRLSRFAQLYASHISLRRLERLPNFDPSITLHPKEWFERQKCGVFIVQIYSTGDVNHVVCLDFSRRWIVDSVEHKPLKLSMESLNTCCGDGSSFIRFGEIRLVEYGGDWRKGKQRRTRNHSKRKAIKKARTGNLSGL